MNQQNEPENLLSIYPKPFESGMMDIGSHTVDTGHEFVFTVDKDGFSATRTFGPFSADDLPDLGYEPDLEDWKGSSGDLVTLLECLATSNGIDRDELLEAVWFHFRERREVDIDLLLSLDAQGSDKSELIRLWPDIHGVERIIGIPSKYREDKYPYDALDLCLEFNGWSATLWCEDGSNELFIPECWSAATFDELMSAKNDYDQTILDLLPWSCEELIQQLIEDDPRWEPFIDASSD